MRPKKKKVCRTDTVLALQNAVKLSTSFLHEDHTCLKIRLLISFASEKKVTAKTM